VAVAIAALGVLLNLAALSEIGSPAQPGSPLAGMDPAVLDKVRALLAKAEATEFEEEADAFLSKAQELMSRYNLDRACLDGARDGSGSGVEALRCWLDDPYWRQKAYLLGVVARANRCRSVVSFDLGMETVIGHRDDLAATELLFTALLLHATKHMAQARTRRSSYRRSFLVAYATRIGDRLSEAAAAATLAAVRDSGVGLLPVLASREASVEEAVERMFPATRPTRFQVTDRDGYVAGLAAADLADLAVQPILTTTEH
jgi:hypothetical protein